jgi:hypothetical protein
VEQVITMAWRTHDHRDCGHRARLQPETEVEREAGDEGVIGKPFDLAALADALPRVLTALDVPFLSLSLSWNPKAAVRRSASV